GRYNWGSTLWHELAHTFTLGASAHRVPRWLSEGLSVYEERRAEPAWGADVTASFLQAFLANRLAPASRLNDGFMRPAYPEQVPFSYYQASIVCELIERHHGIAGLRRMLGAFAEGKSSDEVFRQVLRIEPRAMDSLFVRYVRDRFAGQLAAVMPKGDPGEGSDFERALARARERRNAGQTSEAIEELRRAKAMFPGYVGADAPSRQLAELYERSGDSRAALGELGELAAVDEDGYATNRKLAALALSLGDTAAAAAALDRVMYMHPYDAAAHAELAGLSFAAGDFDRAVRERRAAVALNPPDLLEARYQLAATLFAAGRREDARRELLRLLDSAPHFAKAQDLLLRLRAAPQEG
ncbi:MAG: peptidase MA family metallohydrolase, partial [Gemmatimonadaceae bacterium]